MEEVWKSVLFFEGDYEISNLCRVRSLKNNEPLILATSVNKKGYYYFTPSKNGKVYFRLIHRVIAEAFIPNPNGHKIVRHLNDIPGDNRIENLAWGTNLDNSNDGKRNGVYLYVPKGEKHHLYGKTGLDSNAGIPVLQIKLDGSIVKEWGSANEAANKLKISRGNINSCCRGVAKTAGGFKWERRLH